MSLSCRMWHAKEAVIRSSTRWFAPRPWSKRHSVWLWILVLGLCGGAESIWALVL